MKVSPLYTGVSSPKRLIKYILIKRGIPQYMANEIKKVVFGTTQVSVQDETARNEIENLKQSLTEVETNVTNNIEADIDQLKEDFANLDIDVATTAKAGKVRPDGETITVEEDGTIHGTSQEFKGTRAEWNTLSDTEKAKHSVIIFTDDKKVPDDAISSLSYNKINLTGTYLGGKTFNIIMPQPGSRLRKLNLKDVFGVNNWGAALYYAVSQPEAVCIGDWVDLFDGSTDSVTSLEVNAADSGYNKTWAKGGQSGLRSNGCIRVAANPAMWLGDGLTQYGINPDSYTYGTTASGTAQLTFEFANCAFACKYNDDNTNAGGWIASKLRPTVYKLGEVLDSRLQTGSASMPKKVGLAQVYRYYNAPANEDVWVENNYIIEKIFLLSEQEVYGSRHFGGNSSVRSNRQMQLPIYALDPNAKHKELNGSWAWWWLSDPCDSQSRSAGFCRVDDYGYSAWSHATYEVSVSPAFNLRLVS